MKRTAVWNEGSWSFSEDFPDDGSDELVKLSSRTGITGQYIAMRTDEWESLAEHILWDRDRRKEEAKQPKRWVVNLKEGTAELSSDQSGGRGQNIIPLRDGYDEADGLYVWAHSEKDARERAREANHSLGVWIREYLA